MSICYTIVVKVKRFTAFGYINNREGSSIMMSNIPVDLNKVSKENIDKEILRIGMIAELDAINLYEQLAAKAENPDIKKVILDIAKEEKTHVGEFQTLLLRFDKQQAEELDAGKKEVEKETGK